MHDTPGRSTERVRRWRKRHSTENRQQQRRYDARYNSTAKGVLRQVRAKAKLRSGV